MIVQEEIIINPDSLPKKICVAHVLVELSLELAVKSDDLEKYKNTIVHLKKEFNKEREKLLDSNEENLRLIKENKEISELLDNQMDRYKDLYLVKDEIEVECDRLRETTEKNFNRMERLKLEVENLFDIKEKLTEELHEQDKRIKFLHSKILNIGKVVGEINSYNNEQV